MTAPLRTTEHRPASGDRPALEIVRSVRRRRSAAGYVRDGRMVVQLPAGLDPGEEERLIAGLVAKVTARGQARQVGDGELARRAGELADRYLGGVRPTSITWSTRMRRRWGSCTPADGTVRISAEVAAFPDYVLDAVVLHELAHLIEPGHSPAFWDLVARYPLSERAQGFLEGVVAGRGLALTEQDDASDAIDLTDGT